VHTRCLEVHFCRQLCTAVEVSSMSHVLETNLKMLSFETERETWDLRLASLGRFETEDELSF
jgi:hypothetical protein